MSPDDSRHGTVAGFVAHGRANTPACEPCLTAKRAYEKARQMYGNRKIPAVGSQRRIQALRALGHTKEAICEAGGWSDHTSLDYVLRATGVTAPVAERINRAYEQLCMTLADGPKANRVRILAAKQGWAPPLAWNDIDDPDEIPHGWQRATDDWIAEMYDLDDQHAGISNVLTRLGVTRKSLQKRCERHGLMPLYSRFVGRENPRYWVNQYAEGGVA